MKLNFAIATEIRLKLTEGYTVVSIAKVFGITTSAVTKIKNNLIYKTEKKDLEKYLNELNSQK